MATNPWMPLHERWRNQQQELVRVISLLSPEQLALRAAPHLHTVGEMIAHIVAARVRMFHGALGEGDAELDPLAKWDDEYSVASDLATLLHGLTSSWQMIEQTMERWTDADWLATFTETWPNGESSTLSRASILSWALKHDFHHGGEISLTLGVHGLESPEWN